MHWTNNSANSFVVEWRDFRNQRHEYTPSFEVIQIKESHRRVNLLIRFKIVAEGSEIHNASGQLDVTLRG